MQPRGTPGKETPHSPFGLWGLGLLLELMPSFPPIGAGIAYRIPIADENFPFAICAGLQFTFLLHLVVELNVLFIVDLPMPEVVVVVGCHIICFLITKLLIQFPARVQCEY